jgi:hypothetical protein
MGSPRLVLSALAAAALGACGRDADLARSASRAQAPGDVADLDVTPPRRDGGRIARVVRLRIPTADVGDGADALLLLRGEVSATQVARLASGAASAALRERVVPTLGWTDGASSSIQPAVALEAGAAYTLVAPATRFAAPMRVVDEDDAEAWLDRIWPPQGRSGTTRFAAWCGAHDLPPFDERAWLDPGRVPGRLARGVLPGDLGTRCVRWEGEAPTQAVDALAPPPAVWLGTTPLLLDPRPLVDDAASGRGSIEPCLAPELRFGPGCVDVQDDRAVVRSPDEPLLWVVAGEGLDVVVAAESRDAFVVGPLEPERRVRLRVGVVAVDGTASVEPVAFVTGAPRAHLVLNEALADPLGPEPRQEWVEIVNDGAVVGRLGELAFADSGGADPLPDVEIAPGEHVLLVADGFVPDDAVDVPVPPDTRLVRLPRLGHGGLKNSGEELRLLDAAGRVVSRIPPTPPPAPGRSVARVRPSAPDDTRWFVVATPTPGRGNAM